MPEHHRYDALSYLFPLSTQRRILLNLQSSHANLTMFTIKPANDTDAFYAVIKKIEARRILEEVSHSPEYIAKLEKMAKEIARNHRSLHHPSAPFSSVASTFRAPSRPRADDVS